jgi:ABC-type transport system involved in multi-copper enzyme maturation permease subunit
MKIPLETFLWIGEKTMPEISRILRLAVLRIFLMLRQKLGWMSLLVGVAVVCISFVVADVSYINSGKIFFDFALSTSFLIQCFLAIYFGSNLFEDEKARRTLHLILSGGTTRLEWLVGNILGVWVALLLMDLVWFIVTLITAATQFGAPDLGIFVQIKILQGFEALVLVTLSMFFSLWVKPVLALALAFTVGVFSHSVNEIQSIFMDPISGRFIDSKAFSVVYWISKILPPFEWFDLKPLVGYEGPLPWLVALGLVALAIAWSTLLVAGSWLRFDRLDI